MSVRGPLICGIEEAKFHSEFQREGERIEKISQLASLTP